jgi:hypothetical protein
MPSLTDALRFAPGDKRVLRLMPAIAIGIAVFVVMSAVPVALGFLSYGLGLGALAALTLAGLVLSYRAGVLSLFGATFAALLPAALAIGGADDLKTARRTIVASTALAEIARHADAQVLLLHDARVATEFTARWTTRPRAGGAEQHHAAAPLVAPDWRANMPVPAWRVCSGGDVVWCERALAQLVHAARRLTAAEAARYRDGIAEAERRFGLVSAAAAPLLQLATPPDDRARAALTGMIAMPLIGCVVWLAGLLIWRAISRLRRATASQSDAS